MTTQALLLLCPNPFAKKGRVATFGGSDCWIWMGAKTNRGYGHLSFDGKHILAHRLMYILKKGKIKNGLQVCHSCDNPPCVNPSHLWLGTAKENWDDAKKKGRTVACAHRKLTFQQAKEIRISKLPRKQLALKYKISVGAIKDIISKRTFKGDI